MKMRKTWRPALRYETTAHRRLLKTSDTLNGRVTGMHSAVNSDSARFHIVILEDNEIDLLTIKRSLREAGVDYEFTAFADGEEALAYVKETASRVADLMILDLNSAKWRARPS